MAQHRSRDEWIRLVDELERSGVSRAQFAEQRGLSARSLENWAYRLRREAEPHAPRAVPVGFVPLRVRRVALAARAMDYVMPDPQFIRGVTGWLEAAALARQAQMECSSHAFVEASSHLLCATPTAHWLELLDAASPLLRAGYPVVDGTLTPPERPGIGLEWDEAAVAHCRV